MDYGSIVPLRSALHKSQPLFVYPWGYPMSRSELRKAADLPDPSQKKPLSSTGTKLGAGGKAPQTAPIPKPPLGTPSLQLAHHTGVHASADNEIKNWEHQARSGKPLTPDEAGHVNELRKVKDMAGQVVTHLQNQGVTAAVGDYDKLAAHHAQQHPDSRVVESGGFGRVRSADLGSHAQHMGTMLSMQQKPQQTTSAAGALASGGQKGPLQPLPSVGGGEAQGPRGRVGPPQEPPTPTPVGTSSGTTASGGPKTQAEGQRQTAVAEQSQVPTMVGSEDQTQAGGPAALFGQTRAASTPAPTAAPGGAQPQGRVTAIPMGKQQPTLQPEPSFARSLRLLASMMKALAGVEARKSLAMLDSMSSLL